MPNIQKHINYLKGLMEKKEIPSIYSYLNEDTYGSTKEKRDVLEHFLKFLYERLGYQVVLNEGAGDKGVDLFLYSDTTDIPVRAIQVKNHKKPQNIDDIFNDVGKFKEGSNLEENVFSYFSLNGFVNGAKEKVGGRFFLESFKDLISMMDNKLNEDKKIVFHAMSDLYPHNRYAYERIKDHLKKNDKAAIIQPTGSGKMKIILQLLADNALNKEESLVLAPTNVILEEMKKGLPWVANYTTFMTYAKAATLSQKHIEEKLNIKHLILDELHRFGAEKWGEGVQNIIEHSDAIKVAGFTATPNRMDGRNIIEDFFDGDLVSELSLEDAIARKILPLPKYVSAIYTLENEVAILKKKIDDAKISEKEKEEHRESVRRSVVDWQRTSGIKDILSKHLAEKNEDPKFIIFCENVAALNELKPIVIDWFASLFQNVEVKSVYSKKSGLKENISWFKETGTKDTVKLLMSVNMLNEGLHVKGITGVVFLRKTASEIIFKQQLGRALSSAENDKTPLVFDFVNNFTLLNSKDFEERLKESIKREQYQRNGLGLGEGRIIDVCLVDEVQDIRDILSGVVSKLNKSMVDELKEFDATYNEYPKAIGKRLNGREGSLYRALFKLKKNNFKTIGDSEELRFLREYIKKYKRPTIVDELKAFDAAFGEYPRTCGKRLKGREESLYRALFKLKKSNFKTIEDPEELSFLKIYIKKYKQPTVVDELKEFDATFGEYPKKGGKRLNGRESSIYSKLGILRRFDFKTIEDPEDLIFLKEYVEKYKQPTLVDELKEFDAAFGEYPRTHGKRLNGREEALYSRFTILKRENFKKIKDPEEFEFFREYVEKYKQPTFIEELKEFEATYGGYPTQYGKRLEGRESALHARLKKLKTSNFKAITNQEELKFLKEYMEKYKKPTFIEELKEFEATYGEYPKQKGKRLKGREGALNDRLRRLKRSNFEKIENLEELNFLKEYVEKYKQPTFIEELKEFDATYGDYPKTNGKRLNGRENVLRRKLIKLKKSNFETIIDPEELQFLKKYF